MIGRSLKSLRDSVTGRVVILVYHRVAEVESDPWSLAVSPSTFTSHLEVIRRITGVLRLEDVAPMRRPAKGVVITFDDGYADNWEIAHPLLESLEVPATVFVTTSTIDSTSEFWWDELERLILHTPRLPRVLRLDEFPSLECQLDDDESQDTGWSAASGARTSRERLFLQLWALLSELDAFRREPVMQKLSEWSGRSRAARDGYLPLSSAQVRALADGGLVEIGAHTRTHARLASVDHRQQWDEISGSRADLERLTGRSPSSFAYPFGRPGTFDARSVRLVRTAGFSRACSTAPGLVRSYTDRFAVPRASVVSWNAGQLEETLRAWLAL